MSGIVSSNFQCGFVSILVALRGSPTLIFAIPSMRNQGFYNWDRFKTWSNYYRNSGQYNIIAKVHSDFINICWNINQVSSTKYFLFPIISQALRVFIVTEFWLSKQKIMHVFLILFVIVYRGIQYITEQLNWINFNLIE